MCRMRNLQKDVSDKEKRFFDKKHKQKGMKKKIKKKIKNKK